MTVAGDPLPAGDVVNNNTFTVVGRFGWSWRPDPLGRIGAEYLAQVDRFEFSSTSHLSNRHQVAQAFLEVDPERDIAVQVFGGVNLDRWSQGSLLVAGARLRYDF